MPDNHHLASDWYGIDFRKNWEKYRIGKGEQGVLTAEPYKSEILPFWRFKTPEIAASSAAAIKYLYDNYKSKNDYVGMDMARKFLQMGYTRSRRYANHRSGKKYDGPVPKDKKGISGSHGREQLPIDYDPVKAKCAEAFYPIWQAVLADPDYTFALTKLRR